MKNVIFSFFFAILTMTAFSQEIVSKTQSIVTQDTNYLLKTVTVTDGGNTFLDTNITYQFLGDSLTALNKIFQETQNAAQFIHAGVNRAFGIKDFRDFLTGANSLYLSITGSDNLSDAANANLQTFYGAGPTNEPPLGIYRIIYGDGTSSFARMVQFASGAYRLRKTVSKGGADVTPVASNQYIVQPIHTKSFDITADGVKYSFWLDENVNNPAFDVYRPLQYIPGLNGTPIYRIFKFKTQ